jgi:hypothetical protein
VPLAKFRLIFSAFSPTTATRRAIYVLHVVDLATNKAMAVATDQLRVLSRSILDGFV